MLKRFLVIAMVVIMTGGLIGCGKASSVKEIKIGVVCPISGQSAIAGEYMKNGISLIEDQLTADGGLDVKGTKIPVTFVYEDDEAKPDTTANVYRKLIDQDKVLAIVGPDMSKCILAAGPIAQAAKIPAIGTFTTNVKVTEIGDYIFRACFIDPFQGKVMATYARNTVKANTAAVLYNNADDYSLGLEQSFVTVFEQLGGKVVTTQAYSGADIKDFNAQLSRIKAAKPDVLFLPNLFSEIPLQTKQARAMGITAQFLGGDSWDSPDVPNIAGNATVEGSAFAAAFSPDNPSTVAQDFVKRYEKKFNVPPNSNAVLAYEAAEIVLKGVQGAATLDGTGIRDAMAKISGLQLPSGSVSFDANRNPVKGAVVMTYKGGATSYVTSINP